MKEEKFIFNDDIMVNSLTECTGLIQIPPTTEAEAESYSDLMPIPKQINTSLLKKPEK